MFHSTILVVRMLTGFLRILITCNVSKSSRDHDGGAGMRNLPWSEVSSWHCNSCGICCKNYAVVLGFPEWLNIVKNFGVEYTAPTISKFSMRRRLDGTCVFLRKVVDSSFCSLQHMKPQACKLWPFKVLSKPKFGSASRAVYHYQAQRLFIYADPVCPGLRRGVPTQEFAYSVIPEFIEIALGVRQKQLRTTSFLNSSFGPSSHVSVF